MRGASSLDVSWCVLVGWLYEKVVGPLERVFQGPHPLKVVVAVSYSPTPSQVQYHRRLRA